MNTRATASQPHREPSRGFWSVLSSAAWLMLRAVEFGFYHLLLTTVDRVSRLPRNTTMPEAARLYRENIALKAQLGDDLPKPRRSDRETRGDRRPETGAVLGRTRS